MYKNKFSFQLKPLRSVIFDYICLLAVTSPALYYTKDKNSKVFAVGFISADTIVSADLKLNQAP